MNHRTSGGCCEAEKQLATTPLPGQGISINMRDNYHISLKSNDLGQLLDGLEVRRKDWMDTARYLRTGKIPSDDFIREECSGPDEADSIAEHYKRILGTICRQRATQNLAAKGARKSVRVKKHRSRPGFCIYVDTVLDGPVPVERDGTGNPFIYPNEVDAQREIADIAIGRFHEFLEGEREFDDAMTIEEYVMPVDVMPDGSVWDEAGRRVGRNAEC